MAQGVVDQAPASDSGNAARFEVDATWPKELPNNWILGPVGGVAADHRGHIWVFQRPWEIPEAEIGAALEPPVAVCCTPAPPVIEFDAQGNVVQAWPPLRRSVQGDVQAWEAEPGPYGDWGRREHAVFVDHNDYVWLSNDNAHVIRKFTRDGKFVLQIGEPGVTGGSNDPAHLGRPAGLAVDAATNELYVADGYTNKRVIVFDAETGAYRRHWGAYGQRPDDALELGEHDPSAPPARQFRGPVHGIALSRDGLVYVADRGANRVQVFRRNGDYVTEFFVATWSRGFGAAYDVKLSPDDEQRWLYVSDGENNVIWILRRDSGDVVGSVGHAGRSAGQFIAAHSLTVDPQGNIYVGETRGQRVQKLKFLGGGR